MTSPRRACLVFLALLSLGLVACGGGSAAPIAPPGGTGALTITTVNLPGGTLGAPISCPPLEVTNAQGTPVWDLTSGALPDGLVLSPTGNITGTPTAEGLFAFVVRATDSVGSDTQPLDISVGIIAMSVSGGVVQGDAWTQKPVTLTTSGATASVSFSVVASDSGGAFASSNPAAGTAVWTPGPTGGAGVLDTLRATDTGSGQAVDVSFPVMPDPSANHTASFGSTDVWWVDPSEKFGTHAFTTDFHKALADAGLRAPGSTGAVGSEADELADLWFRIEILRQVNVMFLRNADGSAGAQGLPISFPFEEPGAGYTKPGNAGYLGGSPTRYSQMGLTHGSTNGVIGTAFVDGTLNPFHENDTSDATMELGVFTNQIVPIFNGSYRSTLDDNPITGADVDALKALLYELPNPGGRYTLIRDIGRGLARTIAAVLAHEAGHSLGLGHTSPSAPNSIMNASASISPSATYSFTSQDVTTLQAALPGTGKTTGGQSAHKPGAVPEGGVVVCNCRAHTPAK